MKKIWHAEDGTLVPNRTVCFGTIQKFSISWPDIDTFGFGILGFGILSSDRLPVKRSAIGQQNRASKSVQFLPCN